MIVKHFDTREKANDYLHREGWYRDTHARWYKHESVAGMPRGKRCAYVSGPAEGPCRVEIETLVRERN